MSIPLWAGLYYLEFMNSSMKILREPLLQFFFIGLCIYGVYAFYGTPEEGLEGNTIIVDANRIAAFTSVWESRWKRPPTEQELEGLIDQFIREDILYREAVAMGLDKNDPITRRRLAQKLEFLTKDIARLKEPATGELESYFEKNIDQFRTPDLITFTHVFIDPDARGDATLDDAAKILADLQAVGPPDASTRDAGDRFMLQNYYPQKSELEIRKQFGSGFATSVMQLEPGQWHGPVLSGYGTHLVYVDALTTAPLPVFEEVEEEVKQNWIAEQQEQFNQAFFESLKSRYEIVIETVPLKPDDDVQDKKDIAEETGTIIEPAS
jgi:peptidyl-prolyl cis-trans isomerase C